MRILGKYSLTVLFFFSFLITEAQKKKENEGFIITLQNDTIECTFKQKNWKKNPIAIKVNFNNKDTFYSPETINGFVVASSQLEFVSREIRFTNYVDKIQEATTSMVPELAPPQKLFLRTLYKGRFTLYLTFDKLNRQRFFIEGSGNLTELYTHYYIQMPPENRSYEIPITILNRSHEFALKTLMTPCRSLFNILENINVDEYQLIQVCKMYDMCLDSKKEN
jgi:hypothetical protein